jgi:hypothetical protein
MNSHVTSIDFLTITNGVIVLLHQYWPLIRLEDSWVGLVVGGGVKGAARGASAIKPGQKTDLALSTK